MITRTMLNNGEGPGWEQYKTLGRCPLVDPKRPNTQLDWKIPEKTQNILTIADKSIEEFQLHSEEFVTNESPLETLYLYMKTESEDRENLAEQVY